MSNAQKVSDERLAEMLKWCGKDDGKWMLSNDEVSALVAELQSLRAAPTPDATRGPCIPVVYCRLATSTHVPVGSDEDHCDLCGHPAQPYAAPTPDAHSEVGVKDLEWRAVGWVLAHANTGLGHWYGVHAADPLLRNAPFRLTLHLAHPSQISISGSMVTLGQFETIEEAKAAAQADFAQRVQSCLTAAIAK